MMHDSGELPGAEGEHRAQEMFGTAKRALTFYNKQVLDFLNPLMCEFIRAQQMMFIATSDGRGHADSSLRTGPPGFVHVLDARTLIYPEYRGNGVMASVGNLLENPHIGLLFIDFVGSTIGLHVNGKARIVEKFELLDSFINSNSGTDVQLPLFDSLVLTSEALEPLMELTLTRGGRQPERWIAVQVAEAYIHCSKHIPKFLQLDKEIHWGTDDDTFKGGDAFKAKNCPRPWVRPQDLNATASDGIE